MIESGRRGRNIRQLLTFSADRGRARACSCALAQGGRTLRARRFAHITCEMPRDLRCGGDATQLTKCDESLCNARERMPDGGS